MNAHFAAQHAVSVAPFHLKRGAVHANAFAGHNVQITHAPTLRGRVAREHTVQHFGPVLRLKTALTWVDGHNGIATIKLARKPRLHFQVIQKLLERV